MPLDAETRKPQWQRPAARLQPRCESGGDHSPNSLFAASFARTGFAMEIPQPELYYRFLREHQVKRIRGLRGAEIKGLYYYGDALEPYLHEASSRGGRRKQMWIIRRERRDRRVVYFQDPLTPEWHPLRWTGLPPESQVPAFGDLRAEELLTRVREAGLRPRSDAELLPILLELLGARDPVGNWPSQMTKSQRVEHAREATQAQVASTDRLAASAEPTDPPRKSERTAGNVLQWPQRAGQNRSGLDAERRRRREAAAPVTQEPPPQLGSSFRERNVFLLRRARGPCRVALAGRRLPRLPCLAAGLDRPCLHSHPAEDHATESPHSNRRSQRSVEQRLPTAARRRV